MIVLLVDDDYLVRYAAAAMLEEIGYEVLEAVNSNEALEILSTQYCDISVMLTDVNMPGKLNGLGLSHVVHQRWNHIGVVIMSGRMTVPVEDIPNNGCFLCKPYRINELECAIASSLGRVRSSGSLVTKR